jgi:hypothetical protein
VTVAQAVAQISERLSYLSLVRGSLEQEEIRQELQPLVEICLSLDAQIEAMKTREKTLGWGGM